MGHLCGRPALAWPVWHNSTPRGSRWVRRLAPGCHGPRRSICDGENRHAHAQAHYGGVHRALSRATTVSNDRQHLYHLYPSAGAALAGVKAAVTATRPVTATRGARPDAWARSTLRAGAGRPEALPRPDRNPRVISMRSWSYCIPRRGSFAHAACSGVTQAFCGRRIRPAGPVRAGALQL